MKITGARSEPFSAIRRRALAEAGESVAAQSAAKADEAVFLGVPKAEMTPAVQAALQILLSEVDDLKGEVSRLKARLAQAEDLADRDGLTPLLNRRAFVRELGRIGALGQRYGMPASLVYFDLDGFKAVNDRYGHAAGDAAIQAVAARLAARVRETDLLGRLGGDEFAVVLVQTDRTTAEAKAAALAQVIEAEPIRFGDWSAPIRLSYGVREIDPAVAAETLLAEADAAMFAAKRGRKAG